MKKWIALLLCVLIAVTAAGCKGEGPSSSIPSQSSLAQTSSTEASQPQKNESELFSQAIQDARKQEVNDSLPVMTSKDDPGAELIFDMFQFNSEDMQAFALSISPVNIKAYGVAVIRPTAGKEEAVLESVNGFVQQQQKAFEQYLADQKVIADNAIVETLDSGVIVLVMCEDAQIVYDSIVENLK